MIRLNHTHWLLPLVAALICAGCGKSDTERADTSGGEQSVETAPEPAAEQQRALAEIATKLGGKLIYDGTSPAKLAIGVDLSETQITDAGLEHLQGLTQLQELNLRGTQVYLQPGGNLSCCRTG